MAPSSTEFDVIIVGGGPAGLSAALLLGRCLRRVLVCDAGQPRNRSSRALHGYLSQDGVPPAEFLETSRQQLRRYETVRFQAGDVMSVQRLDDGFEAVVQPGGQVSGRMLLLATGVVDQLPEVEGIRTYYGKSVHHCPYCHGWECRGQPIAVLGRDDDAVDLAIELLQWSSDIVVCSNGRLDHSARKKLESYPIAIRDQTVARLDGHGEQLLGVRFADGTFLPREALFFSPRQQQQSPLAQTLGCRYHEDQSVCCAEDGATGIPGLFLAGNTSKGVQLVIAAAAKGALAAVAINNALLKAEGRG